MHLLTPLESLLSEIEELIDRLEIDEGRTLDDIFDDCDSAPFEELWLAVFRHVESRKAVATASPEHVDLVRRIREAAFLRTMERWQSSDLAGYVSDDFGLIADAIAFGIDDSWIAGMLRSYRNGRIPPADSGKTPSQ